ncbi:PTS transporter subunit IIC [Clostridium tertium]|uniref:PTS transporter subunit IIC n=1 Tax=Clostridium tertium TaxID=1559 RepID=UPI00241FB49B|nr:PTS sugar transporter subunit IIC [Clostridium tertium]
MSNEKMTAKQFMDKLLAGLSVGIVVALIPNALLGELLKVIIPHFAPAQTIFDITLLAMRLSPMVIGVCIAMQFKLTPIQITAVGMAAVVGSGVASVGENGSFIFAGTGDVINVAITAAIAVGIVMLLGNKLKAYTILLVPAIVVIVAGGITLLIGDIINKFTTLQPILMGILISLCFAFLIISPFSTVAVATAIALGGIGSGAANLGVVATGFGLAICGWKVNSFGTSIAHFLGSPKMQMVNFVKKPIMMVPIFCNAAILGALAGIFNIQGTPMSAGFGISGLIGPINALNLMGGYTTMNVIIVTIIFVVVPIALGILFNYIFTKIVKIVSEEDYKLTFE